MMRPGRYYFSLVRLILICAACLGLTAYAFAQTDEEYEPIPAEAKQESKTADLDRLLQNLKGLKAKNDEQKEQFMKLHKTISNGYASNGNYKIAYEEYMNYLELKEELFLKDFSETVRKAKQSYEERSIGLENSLNKARETEQDALASVQHWDTLRSVYQKFFSLGLLALTVVFSLSFVRSGVRMVNMRKETDSLRKRITGMHRLSMLGRITPGNINGHKQAGKHLVEQSVSIAEKLKDRSGESAKKAAVALSESKAVLKS